MAGALEAEARLPVALNAVALNAVEALPDVVDFVVCVRSMPRAISECLHRPEQPRGTTCMPVAGAVLVDGGGQRFIVHLT